MDVDIYIYAPLKVLCILAATMASKLEKRATILILTGLDTFKPQEVL